MFGVSLNVFFCALSIQEQEQEGAAPAPVVQELIQESIQEPIQEPVPTPPLLVPGSEEEFRMANLFVEAFPTEISRARAAMYSDDNPHFTAEIATFQVNSNNKNIHHNTPILHATPPRPPPKKCLPLFVNPEGMGLAHNPARGSAYCESTPCALTQKKKQNTNSCVCAWSMLHTMMRTVQ